MQVVTDLLQQEQRNSTAQTTPSSSWCIPGVTHHAVQSASECEMHLHRGNTRRNHSTSRNRMHTAFAITVEVQQSGESSRGTLLLVDTADSEVGGAGLPGGQIEHSMQFLNSVIQAKQPSASQNESHPDAALTAILRQSLGGNASCLMIATISPLRKDHEATLNTLRTATAAAIITNSPAPNKIGALALPILPLRPSIPLLSLTGAPPERPQEGIGRGVTTSAFSMVHPPTALLAASESPDPRGATSSESASTSPEASTEASLRSLFNSIDKNKDGTVNRRELIIALRSNPKVSELLGLPTTFQQGSKEHTAFERFFQNLDVDSDREISWQEFRVLASTHSVPPNLVEKNPAAPEHLVDDVLEGMRRRAAAAAARAVDAPSSHITHVKEAPRAAPGPTKPLYDPLLPPIIQLPKRELESSIVRSGTASAS